MKVTVEIHKNLVDYVNGDEPWRMYEMDHDDAAQRRVLGEQCRNAFEAGQVVLTYPLPGQINRR